MAVDSVTVCLQMNVKEMKMIKTFDISWKSYLLPSIHNEGWRFVGIFAAITALLAIIWEPLGWMGLVLTIWCYYFFRDPQRVTPEINDVVVSPADGIVQMIAKVPAPEELNMGDKKFTRVSIFMSVFNVHVNRAPAEGKIINVYIPKISETKKVHSGYKYELYRRNKEIYELLLSKYNLKAEECVFFDDKEENTAAAEKIGIKSYTITSKEYLLEILDEFLA